MYNVLIIGVSGFVGKNLLEIYRNSSSNVFYTIRDDLYVHNSFNVCKCELADTKLIIEFIEKNNIRTIVHLASTLVPSSDNEAFLRELETIVMPTYKLIDYSSRSGIKFVFFSSGGTIYGKSENELIGENHHRSPINYYGYSKLMIENYILFQARVTDLKYLIIRPSNVYGKYQKLDRNQGFIAVAINKILNNEPIEIWGDGNIIRDYMNVEDLALITKKLLDKKIENKVVNVGSGIGTSLNDIVSLLSIILCKEIKVLYKTKRSVDVDKMVLDTSLLESIISVEPIALEKGILQYINSLEVFNEKQ